METNKKFILPKQLAAASLLEDSRVKEAKKLLKEAVADHQRRITDVSPPIETLKQKYEEMLKAMEALRGGKLWFPFLGSGIGNGALVELADGSVKYDFICGIGVHYLGHSHPSLIDVAIDAAISDTIMQGNLQQNVDSLILLEKLSKVSGFPHCFLTTSGAMANENALKIAFQKHHPASRILAFEQCFAGRTLTLSQITDKAAFREELPTNLFVDYLPFFDAKHPQESIKHTVDVLKKTLARYPKQHALMCFEFILGEGGFYVGTREFFKAIISILKENKIAVFADEVQSFGRTQELFAFQHFGLQSDVDLVSIGKLSQVCATFFTEEYKPRVGLLSQTFTGSTSAIKAASVTLDALLNEGYYGSGGKIQKLHLHFVRQLEDLSKRHPDLIQGPFGAGGMIAFTPYDGTLDKVTDFVHRLFHAGVMGFIAGKNPVRIRFLIPGGTLTLEDIDKAMKIIENTLLEPV